MSQYGLVAMISLFCWIWTHIHKIPVRTHDCRHCSPHTAGHSVHRLNGNHCVLCVCPAQCPNSDSLICGDCFIIAADIPEKRLQKAWRARKHTWSWSEPAIICMAETHGCGDKPELQTQLFLRLGLFNHACWRWGYLCTRCGHHRLRVQSPCGFLVWCLFMAVLTYNKISVCFDVVNFYSIKFLGLCFHSVARIPNTCFFAIIK